MRTARKRNLALGVLATTVVAAMIGIGAGTATAQDDPIAVITPPSGPLGTDYVLTITCEGEPEVERWVVVPPGDVAVSVPVETVDNGDGTWSLSETAGMNLVGFEVTCGEVVENVAFERDMPVETTTTEPTTTTTTSIPVEPAPAAQPVAGAAVYAG
jgi:hypothetical protein